MLSRVMALVLAVSLNACSQLPPCRPDSAFVPPPGAPYTAEPVRIEAAAGHVLAGTLTLPTVAPRPLPAVILISGSHAQDRDHVGSTREPARRYQPFRQIADALSRRGIAVLRMDDRGVGCSSGGPLADVPVVERAEDTVAGLGFVRARADIDSERIALIGLSEGANLAVHLAAADPAIAAIVTMAATATPGWEVYVSQQRRLMENDVFTSEEREQLEAGVNQETILARRTKRFRREVAAGQRGRWWPSFMAFDPSQVAGDVTCPVLILHGDRDTNVPVEHATLLAAAIRGGGNRDVTVQVFPDHNHLFLPDTDGFFRRYGSLLVHTNQLPPQVLNQIANWIGTRLENHGRQH